ncbi:hypothetical protein V5H82_06520 [Helicobacter pylori]
MDLTNLENALNNGNFKEQVYSDSIGEMVLCLKANSKAWPVLNSFYQNKTADYKIAVFARRHKDSLVNVNCTASDRL